MLRCGALLKAGVAAGCVRVLLMFLQTAGASYFEFALSRKVTVM